MSERSVKRFVLFAGASYYPMGGWDDYEGSFDTLEEARKEGVRKDFEWWHVIDLETGDEVWNGRRLDTP